MPKTEEIVQIAGGAAVSLGFAMQWPWIGAVTGGAFALLFGIAMERKAAEQDARTTPSSS